MDRRRVSVAMCQYNPHGIDATQKKGKDVDKKVMSKVKKNGCHADKTNRASCEV